ncbi:hypothetical protein [Burkholderia sp. 3C]
MRTPSPRSPHFPHSPDEPFRVPLARPARAAAIPAFLRDICRGLIDRQREDELLPWADQALAIDPFAAEFVEMRVQALSLAGRHREAAEMLRRHAGLPWPRAGFDTRLGHELAMAGDLEAGIRHLDLGMRHATTAGDTAAAALAAHRLGEAWLKLGEPRGFAGWLRRNDDPVSSGSYRTDLPMWNGGDVSGRRVLITHQLGFGDQLLMLAAARDWLHAGARLMISCDTPLLPLLRASLPDCRVVDAPRPVGAGEPLPEALRREIAVFAPDLHASLLHLPLLDATRARPRGRFEPYLRVPTDRARAATLWARRMRAAAPGRKLVGLCYDCSHRHRPELGSAARCWAARRSLPREAVERLIAHPALASRVLFVSLHHPSGEALAGGLPRGMRHYAPDIEGFDDTAACIRELDAVIAVDSSVANLAALLGAPTCVPVNRSGDWRWGSVGTVSPWLPGVTVLRQRDSGDWQPVLEGLVGWVESVVLGGEAGASVG